MDQLDLALDDFLKGDIRDAHAGTGGDERGTAAVELFHTLGNQVDQHEWVGDNFRGLFKKIAFHRRTGKSRNRPRFLERDEALRREPCDEFPWDGVGDVRPFQSATRQIIEGVY